MLSGPRYRAGMRFPAFQLETGDGERVTEDALRGDPSVVYLARHPG